MKPSLKQQYYNIKLLWAERDRVWAWMHRHQPLLRRRYTFLEACSAVLNNPPAFDASWDMDMEPPRYIRRKKKVLDKSQS